jgi:hypothetical protein
MSLEKLIKQLMSQGKVEPGIVTSNPYDAPPITIPTVKPWFPGVNPCGSNLADKDSCEMCDKLAAISGAIGGINSDSVRNKLIKATAVMQSLCALLRGCSEKTSGNQYPWADGTACVCAAFKKLFQDFEKTVGAALLQTSWDSNSTKNINDVLLKQKKACISSIQACFRLYQNSISDNLNAQKGVINILNGYAV